MSTSAPPSAALPAFLRASPSGSGSGSGSATPPPSAARLSALYAAAAPQRATNPTGYSANAAWWAGVLAEGVRSGWLNGEEGDRLMFKLDEALGERFIWEGKRPRGLAGFIETLVTSSPPRVVPMPTYQSSATPLLAPPSATSRFVARPLAWAFAQLNPFGGAGGGESTDEDALIKMYARGREYVHLELVQRAAAQYKAHVEAAPPTAYSDSVYDLEGFHAAFRRVCLPRRRGETPPEDSQKAEQEEADDAEGLSKRDTELLVRWLMRDEDVLVTDGTIIKVLDPGERASEHSITEVDRGVVSVLNALRRVEAQITRIEAQVKQCQVKAKAYIAASQKPLAMAQLRMRRALEDVLEKRVGVVEQLSGVIRGIDQASSDAEVMAAYETSNSALRQLLANPLLDKDRVERTTEQLADTLADQREIDEAVRLGGALAVRAGGAADDEAEDELARELAELVEDEKKREAEEEAARREAEKARVRAEEQAKVDRQRIADEVRRESEERERQRKEQERVHEVERAKREEEEREREIERRLAMLKEAQPRAEAVAPEGVSGPDPAVLDAPVPNAKPHADNDDAPWSQRYADARQREAEERGRAEAERRKKEDRLLAE